MKFLATILVFLATAAIAAGLGGNGDRPVVRDMVGHGEQSVLAGERALPQGHPPLGGLHRSLPEGHPPVPGYGHGLPEGHPVCPAGRKMLERGPGGGWNHQESGPALIST